MNYKIFLRRHQYTQCVHKSLLMLSVHNYALLSYVSIKAVLFDTKRKYIFRKLANKKGRLLK
jgi:hypothetical protein